MYSEETHQIFLFPLKKYEKECFCLICKKKKNFKNVHNEGNKYLPNYNFACNTEKN